MSRKEEFKQAIKKQMMKIQPRMDINEVKQELLDWLEQLDFSFPGEMESWMDRIKVFPPEPGETEMESGVRMRLLLRLYTQENRYLLSIMECLDPNARGAWLISVHVNWKINEWRMQKALEKSYRGKFDDSLKARHTVWAQTVLPGGLWDALNSCALAILANELVAEPLTPLESTPVRSTTPVNPGFPSPDQD